MAGIQTWPLSQSKPGIALYNSSFLIPEILTVDSVICILREPLQGCQPHTSSNMENMTSPAKRCIKAKFTGSVGGSVGGGGRGGS